MRNGDAAAKRPHSGIFARPESARQRPRSGRLQGCPREQNLRSQILLLRTEAIPVLRKDR